MRAFVPPSIALIALLLAPVSVIALPDLVELENFFAFELSSSAACDGAGECIAVDVSLNPSVADADVILFDLHVAWDPTYWELDAIVNADVVERDDARGFLDDLFGDVGAGPPIASGSPLFQLVFEVTGSFGPARDVLSIGDLSSLDADFFDRAVLVGDSGFGVLSPTPNSHVQTPEPSTGLMLGLGLLGLGIRRRTRGTAQRGAEE